MNRELREDLEHLIICNDKSITQDLRDDVKMTLDYIDNLEEQLSLLVKDDEKSQDTIIRLSEENKKLHNQYDLMENSLDEKQEVIDKAIEYIKSFIEIDEETGTYSMPYTFDGYNLYKLLKKLVGEDNE